MPAPKANESYSQFGEDRLLAILLPERTGFYVDVGAHDPWRYSNTALLHLRGWRGINIDADPRAIDRFRQERPNDTNIHIGVGEQSGQFSFSVFNDGAVNSFDEKMVARQEQAFGKAKTITVTVQPLKTILSAAVPGGTSIDYLNIDCEGLDDAVLRGNDWDRFRPRVITIEIHNLKLDCISESATYSYLKSLGYVMRAHYYATSIFHHTSSIRR
jgi:FkbM family methyltransferase